MQGTIAYADVANVMGRLASFVPVYFLVCYMGERVTSSFASLETYAYGMEWYYSPPELQKYLVAMIAVIQRPIVMKGIFSLDYTHDTFKRVSRFKMRPIHYVCSFQ